MATTGYAKQVQSVHKVVQSAIIYHDSGEYEKDIKKISVEAASYLRQKVDQNRGNQKLAVVYDIDETLLSNYDIIKLYLSNLLPMVTAMHDGKDFTFRYNKSLQPKAIAPMKELYNFSKKQKNVTIFIITGTRTPYKKFTVKKLHDAGFIGWKKLYLKPEGFKGDAELYKTQVRKNITKEGYHIVFNIGDQKSDLIGGYAERDFKLPNPYYFIP